MIPPLRKHPSVRATAQIFYATWAGAPLGRNFHRRSIPVVETTGYWPARRPRALCTAARPEFAQQFLTEIPGRNRPLPNEQQVELFQVELVAEALLGFVAKGVDLVLA